MIQRALLYVRTLKNLKPSQLFYMIMRRVLPERGRMGQVETPAIRDFPSRPVFVSPVEPNVDERTIEFLNHRRLLDVSSMDWPAASLPKLWRYNLHYFDYLHWAAWSHAHKCRLIDSWIENNPVGTLDAWEPYTVSLRIVNWIKFFLAEQDKAGVPDHWRASLALQLRWLERNVEYHILANHFIKNGKALLFGGLYFDGADASRQLALGLKILVPEADEQILPDGGHFERSPQYHCIVVEDYLDALSMLAHQQNFCGAGAKDTLTKAVWRAMEFLDDLTAGDGRIPLFNDSAFGIVPEPNVLRDYARQIIGFQGKPSDDRLTRICKADSGYFGYRHDRDSFVVDCGPVGPDYQPGHAHCDTLSYELCVDGQRVIVDAGVYSYENDDMRQYVRSTSAHNTIRIDGAEQSEVWSAFRVGRRAYPTEAFLSDWHDGCLEFRGGHDGYQRLAGKLQHQRRIRMCVAGRWEVEDRVSGEGSHKIESFIHLHPGINIERDSPSTFLLKANDELELQLNIETECDIRQESGWYCPEFGLKDANVVLVLQMSGPLPTTLRYSLKRV